MTKRQSREDMHIRQAVLLGSFALKQAADNCTNGSGELAQAAQLLTRLAERLPEPREVEVLSVRRIRRGSKIKYEVVPNGQ
jgi:hypothetical protein